MTDFTRYSRQQLADIRQGVNDTLAAAKLSLADAFVNEAGLFVGAVTPPTVDAVLTRISALEALFSEVYTELRARDGAERIVREADG
jgi:hypothetical protein